MHTQKVGSRPNFGDCDFSKPLELNDITKSTRKPWTWTPRNLKRRDDVLSVFNDLKQYWPLTERQAFYRLISSRAVNEDHWYQHGDPRLERVDIYKTLGRLLKWMRIHEDLPWEAIVDETRVLTPKVGYASVKEFVISEFDYLLDGYRKCLAHDQKYHIEVWIEKQALLRVVRPIAESYCRRVLCCKGYNSVSFQVDFFYRMEQAKSDGKKPIVLYFGDWDPSGYNMPYSAMQTLRDEFGLTGVEYHRCGINPEQFGNVKADPVPIKATDSRAKKFIDLHGDTCYELDAFHPVELQNLVEANIRRFTNLHAITCNSIEEEDELKFIEELKRKVLDFVRILLSRGSGSSST